MTRFTGRFVLAAGLFLLVGLLSPSWAQPPNDAWTPRQHIPYYDDESEAPEMVVDQAGTVHAFNSKWYDDLRLIIYSRWTQRQGWTEPVDILLPTEKKEARIGGVQMDAQGFFHLVFFSGNDLSASIYYSRAHVSEASRASAWSTPDVIGPQAITPSTADIAADEAGNLFVVYSGDQEGNGLYGVTSTDGGRTWSEPTTIFLTYDPQLWPTHLNHAVDDEGRLHLVWTVVNRLGNGEAVYYANRDVESGQWSAPQVLAVEEGFEADWASVTPYKGELIVIYQNNEPATRWMRRSSDGGRTWSEPVRPFPHVGSYGAASLVVDSGNTLHMFLGNRIGNPATHGMWHSVWQGDGWSDLEAIVSGPVSKEYDTAFDPDNPKAVVVQGNLLLLTWINDPGINGVWYAYTLLDTPQVPRVPLPAPPPTPTALATPTHVATATPAAGGAAGSFDRTLPAPSSVEDPGLALLISVVPAALVVLAIVVGYRWRRGRPGRRPLA